MEEEKKITIMGKEINYGNLSDEKLLKLYKELKEREVLLYKKIMAYNEKYNFIPEWNTKDI